MAFNKIRGSQLQGAIIEESHIKTALTESVLNIDWATRGTEILQSKLVLDYVQKEGLAIASGSASFDPSITAPVAATSTDKGAVTETGKNKVIIRDSVTGEPVLSVDNTEVYGKLTYDSTAVTPHYVVSLFYVDAGALEQPFTTSSALTVDMQFPQRFDLSDVAETFAMNEKFVDGAADVSSRLDLEQIAKDVFGTYTYDHDGNANRAKTLMQELIDETSGVTNTSVKAKTVIDEVVSARGASADLSTEMGRVEGKIDAEVTNRTNADTAIVNKLASNLTGEGASTVGIEDAAAVFTATTVEGALGELEGRVATNETALQSVHGHFVEDKQVLAGDPLIGGSTYTLSTADTFVAGDKSLQVFVNGMLQMVGVHYNELEAGGAGTGGTGVEFPGELIAEGDIIQLRWEK